jgi:glutathione S-transferase
VKFNPGKSAYAEERYAKEAKRLWGVLDRRLAEVEYVAGDYSIADIAIWPWISRFAWQTVDFAEHSNIKRWYMASRPSLSCGRMWPCREDAGARRRRREDSRMKIRAAGRLIGPQLAFPIP